jgi:heterodisulfide reductase subunit A-like polyferredoxin
MVCLEQRAEMPAYPEEVEATLAEGITIRNGWGPRQILGGASMTGLECRRCTSVFGYDGRFNPSFADHDRITIDADQIIIAIGQRVGEGFLKHLGAERERGSIKADEVTLQTSLPGVFAGGDAISGPASVIEAVGAGKRAAESIDRFFNGLDLRTGRFEESIHAVPEELLPATDEVDQQARRTPEELPVARRQGNFNEVEMGLTEEAALAEADRCLNCAICSECSECVRACGQNAIDHSMTDREVELDVGAVILAPGFEEFDARRKGEYGWGRYPNVVTSVQFERMLSAAGPFEGHVIRLSDHREARRIAWIQCVGSRDTRCGNEYCSSICCMASTKQALVAMDHVSGLEATVFYMDIRAHGKDFDQYYERARALPNVHYVKSMPSRIVQVPGTQDARVRYLDEQGRVKEQEFDLVVLAVGMEPSASVSQAASRMGIELNTYGFCNSDRLSPQATSRKGVFVAGAFQEPMDIPATVTQASGAASMAMELLASARHSLVTKKSYPNEHDVTDEPPRIGVFVCHCGMNIGSVVDVEKVVEEVRNQPGVVMADHTMFTCSDSSLSNIKDKIEELRLNRVVVASCTPRTHEPLFRETLREAGLNPYLFEMANIRDQCSWVHSARPEEATNKATELVKMAIARAQFLTSLEGGTLTVDQRGLVIGGGLAGMTAALALADQGFSVHLVESAEKLGGNLHTITHTLEGHDVADFVQRLISQVQAHPKIQVHLSTEVAKVSGHVGQFKTTLTHGAASEEVVSGAIIVATGASKAATSQYLYGKSKDVMTQVELEEKLAQKAFSARGKTVVMIQCVGSRTTEKPYCSRICCSEAIKNALAIKKQDPDAHVYVLYRDVRTYGFRESYYQQARQAGVVFIRYVPEAEPQVSQEHGLTVNLKSPDFPEPICIEADTVVLSTGVEAERQANKRIADMLKVPLNADGFFVEAHLKLRPVDFATEGIFLAGLAHSPKFIDETISQARAAAARAATVLSKTQLDVSAQVSYVNQDKCISCMTCVTVCPYSAPFCNLDGKGQIEAAKCMGCGICVSECPARAIQLHHFGTDQFRVMIQELFGGNGDVPLSGGAAGRAAAAAPISGKKG